MRSRWNPPVCVSMVRDLHHCHEAVGDGVKRVYETEVTPIMKMGKKLAILIYHDF